MSSEEAHGNGGHHHGATHITDKHLESAGQNGGFAGATPLHRAVTREYQCENSSAGPDAKQPARRNGKAKWR
jgi:hypothetical protein